MPRPKKSSASINRYLLLPKGSDSDIRPLFLAVNVVRVHQTRFGDFFAGAVFDGTEEAGAIALVTGGALLFDLNQQGVAVAIERDVFDVLGVAAGLAFHPIFLARAAP